MRVSCCWPISGFTFLPLKTSQLILKLNNMKRTKAEIIAAIKANPSNKVRLAVSDIDGVLRGKVVHKEKLLSIIEGGFGFCSVVFGWDIADVSYDNGSFTGWHNGYPDTKAALVLDSFRTIPWDNDTPFFLADFRTDEGADLAICPRGLLKKVKQQCLEMGFQPFFSQEFEWFNFEETPKSFAAKGSVNPTPLTPGMFGYSILRSTEKAPFFNELFDLLCAFDIPIEGLHTETGPGVYEAAIMYGDVLESADRAILFKTAVKEIAYRNGVIASFMAKWRADLPGCSGHVHQSLWDDSSNLFYNQEDPDKMSDLMRSYIAGQLYCMPHILPMFAPVINSYKRLVEGAWAPTTLTWGMDNRTTALRVLAGESKSTRLETRVCGSDTNPYLAIAGCLASGLYGIKHGLKLEIPAVKGNGYLVKENGILPPTLRHATDNMKNSDIAKELFGETFVEHYTQTREWEYRAYDKAVTDWEMQRYFELI